MIRLFFTVTILQAMGFQLPAKPRMIPKEK
jgi:hypothetical protein